MSDTDASDTDEYDTDEYDIEERYDPNSTSLYYQDWLISKYFPDDNSGTSRPTLFKIAISIESRRSSTSRRLPLPYSATETGVEAWEKLVRGAIESRIARWQSSLDTSTTHKPDDGCALSPPNTIRLASGPKHHRLLQIPELLETILRILSPQDQFTAWCVCSQWRATINHVLAPQFNAQTPCDPVEYGQCADQGTFHLQSSSEEIKVFERRVLSLHRAQLRQNTTRVPSDQRYFPAYLSQAENLAGTTSAAFRSLYSTAFGPFHRPNNDRADYSAYASVSQWLDFSQLGLNPYFTDLFGARFGVKFGRYEIDLNLDCQLADALINRTDLPPAGLHRLIGSMHVTQPPCKCLGIYSILNRDPPFYDQVEPIERLYNDDGIRVDQLLQALHRHTPTVITWWKDGVTRILDDIERRPWTQFRWNESKGFIWKNSPSPKFVIFLDNARMSSDEGLVQGDRNWNYLRGHYTRLDYVCSALSHLNLLAEWERDVFDGTLNGLVNDY